MAQKTPVVLGDDSLQHKPLGSEDTLPVGSIPLSAGEGNMIQAREDGLYFGTTAPADISRLYVSTSLGNDSNPGTKAEPYKTIEAAMQTIIDRNAPGTYVLCLRAGETFTPSGRKFFPGGEWNIKLQYYDDPIFGDEITRNGYYPTADARLKRPEIKIDTYVSDAEHNIIEYTGWWLPTTAKLEFIGCKVTLSQNAGGVTGAGFCWYVSAITFDGCDATLNSNNEGFGSASSILTRQCNFYRNGTAKFFISDFSPGWFDNPWLTSGATNKDPYGKGPDVVGRDWNMRSVVNPDNAMALAAYDRSTKTLFGWSATWDVFV